jgi:hypothetical protein
MPPVGVVAIAFAPVEGGLADGDRPGVGGNVPVEHLDAASHAAGDRVVVGDHDDRGALGVEFFQQRQQ